MPSLDKSVIKQGTAHEIGVLIEDQKEGTEKRVMRLEGGKAALQLAAQRVEAITQEVDKALDAEEMEMGEAKIAKIFVIKAVSVLRQLAVDMVRESVSAEGMVAGLNQAIDTIKKVHDAEARKAQAAKAQAAIDEKPEEAQEPPQPTQKAVPVVPSPPEAPRGRRARAAKVAPKVAPKKDPKANGVKQTRSSRRRVKKPSAANA